jgi:hypothetical protein
LGAWIDNTGELASLMLRAGNAGRNTAAELIAVLAESIAQIPRPYRRRLLMTCDSAGASHGLVDWLVKQNHAADRSVEFSVGFDVDVDVRAAIGRRPPRLLDPGRGQHHPLASRGRRRHRDHRAVHRPVAAHRIAAQPAGELRYRILTTPARLTRGQRYRWLRLPRQWPWSAALASAVTTIRHLPMPALHPG